MNRRVRVVRRPRYEEPSYGYEQGTSEAAWKLVALVSLLLAMIASGLILAGKTLDDVTGFFKPGGKVVQSARSVLLKIERENSLVTTKAYVQAVVRQRDEQWYGNAEVIRLVPATIHYAVDLNQIDRDQFEYDDATRTLSVPLPDPQIQSIDPDLAKAEIIRNLDFLRTESLTGNVLEQTTEKMIRPTLEQLGKSPEITRAAKEQAITSVKQLLESSLGATGKQVIVRPYFKSDGKRP